MSFDVIKWGLLIGSLLFCSIQLCSIAAGIRNINKALTILVFNSIMPDIAKEVGEELKNE